jgi:hypothetical protein
VRPAQRWQRRLGFGKLIGVTFEVTLGHGRSARKRRVSISPPNFAKYDRDDDAGGVSSPTLNHVPVIAIDARMDDGATFEHELGAGANAFLLVLEGSAIVGRQERPVASGELAWLTRSEEAPSLVTIKAGGGATHHPSTLGTKSVH